MSLMIKTQYTSIIPKFPGPILVNSPTNLLCPPGQSQKYTDLPSIISFAFSITYEL